VRHLLRDDRCRTQAARRSGRVGADVSNDAGPGDDENPVLKTARTAGPITFALVLITVTLAARAASSRPGRARARSACRIAGGA